MGGYESEKKVWGAVTKPSNISKPPISPNLRVFFGKLPLFAVLHRPPTSHISPSFQGLVKLERIKCP